MLGKKCNWVFFSRTFTVLFPNCRTEIDTSFYAISNRKYIYFQEFGSFRDRQTGDQFSIQIGNNYLQNRSYFTWTKTFVFTVYLQWVLRQHKRSWNKPLYLKQRKCSAVHFMIKDGKSTRFVAQVSLAIRGGYVPNKPSTLNTKTSILSL